MKNFTINRAFTAKKKIFSFVLVACMAAMAMTFTSCEKKADVNQSLRRTYIRRYG